MTFFQQIREAINHDDFDDAVAAVQNIIGVECGGFAGNYFDGDIPDDWIRMSQKDRAEEMFKYMAAEFYGFEFSAEPEDC